MFIHDFRFIVDYDIAFIVICMNGKKKIHFWGMQNDYT